MKVKAKVKVKCAYCPKELSKNRMREHQSKHKSLYTKFTSFACHEKYCELWFENPSHLRLHMELHREEEEERKTKKIKQFSQKELSQNDPLHPDFDFPEPSFSYPPPSPNSQISPDPSISAVPPSPPKYRIQIGDEFIEVNKSLRNLTMETRWPFLQP